MGWVKESAYERLEGELFEVVYLLAAIHDGFAHAGDWRERILRERIDAICAKHGWERLANGTIRVKA